MNKSMDKDTPDNTTKKLSLKEIQNAFYESIFNPKDKNNIQVLSEKITNSESPLNPEDRIDIYRNSILGGITDALAAIYPVCVKLVGETFFTHMVAGYLKQYPSGSPDLGNYGEHLPQYITNFKPAQELIYLPYVAQLEWYWHKAFNAEEANTNKSIAYSIPELGNLREDQQALIQFCLSPSAHLMVSPYPVQKIWEVNQDDFEGEPQVNLDEGEVKLVVWRCPAYGMRIDVLTDSEFQFLTALSQKQPFGTVAQLALEESINTILPRCIEVGLIAGFNLAE